LSHRVSEVARSPQIDSHDW